MESTIQHKELYSVFCGNLNGKEIQKKRGYMYTADSLYFTIETQHCKATILL